MKGTIVTDPMKMLQTNAYNILVEGDETQGMEKGEAKPHMDKIISWNVRGMNALNKQEDIKVFLQQEQTGMVSFLETMVQEHNIQQVMSKVCAN